MKDFLNRFVGSSCTIPTSQWGDVRVEAASLSAAIDGDLILRFGSPPVDTDILVRIHSECVFGEVLGSVLCDCAEQLQIAMRRLSSEGGILFYLRIDGRGAGLAAKVAATALERGGVDTWDSRIRVGVEPESRDYSSVGRYLLAAGLRSIRLLTNNPTKVHHMSMFGIHVTREPLVVPHPNDAVRELYATKVRRFGHIIEEGLGGADY